MALIVYINGTNIEPTEKIKETCFRHELTDIHVQNVYEYASGVKKKQIKNMIQRHLSRCLKNVQTTIL